MAVLTGRLWGLSRINQAVSTLVPEFHWVQETAFWWELGILSPERGLDHSHQLDVLAAVPWTPYL